jgi:hypothetical protein
MAKRSARKSTRQQKSQPKTSATRRPADRHAAAKPARLSSAAKNAASATEAYEKKKLATAARERESSKNVRDIGPMPPPEDPKRREACRNDLGKFLKTYFPGTFRHDWSHVHLRLIELITLVVISGALLAIGIPRGWGKTSLCVRSVIWAIAYRHHVFCVLIAASNDSAKNLIADIRTELEQNEILREDFPEICLPIKNLEDRKSVV